MMFLLSFIIGFLIKYADWSSILDYIKSFLYVLTEEIRYKKYRGRSLEGGRDDEVMSDSWKREDEASMEGEEKR